MKRKGIGEQLLKYCEKHQFGVSNTLCIPMKNDKHNTETWNSRDGHHTRKRDYIMVSNAHRNWVKYVTIKGISDPNE